MGIVLDNLDMELILSGDLEIAYLSEILNNSLISYIYISYGSGAPEYNFFHKIRENDDKNFILSLKNMNAVEINNILRAKMSTKSTEKVTEFVSKIIHLPSAVLTSVWLSKGRFHVQILFNHSIYKVMSKTLMENLTQNPDIFLEHLGESGGFNTVFSKMDSRSQIMIAQLELHPPSEELDHTRNPMGDSWVQILKVPLLYESLDSVFFLENEIDPKGDSLKVTSNIYEAKTTNAFAKAMVEKLNKYRIPLEIRVYILRDGKISTLLGFPEIFRDEFVSILSELFHEQPQWKAALVRLEKYGDWVQDIFNLK